MTAGKSGNFEESEADEDKSLVQSEDGNRTSTPLICSLFKGHTFVKERGRNVTKGWPTAEEDAINKREINHPDNVGKSFLKPKGLNEKEIPAGLL